MNVVVASYPEDLATEFLSVLDREPADTLPAVLVSDGVVVSLPAGGARSRLTALAPYVDAAGESGPLIEESRLASLLRDAIPDGRKVWTHCPADERRDRARIGWLTARVHASGPVLHSVGVSSHYQFLSDVATQLTVEQVRLKLEFLEAHASALVCDNLSPRHIPTAAVPACERFVCLTVAQADRMYALLHSTEDDASLTADPWDFRNSEYECERLRQTAEWVGRRVAPESGLLVEIGACEGALTARLLDAGYCLIACEPNERFRTRLADVAKHRAKVRPDSLEGLLQRVPVPARAYLLIEMLYYLGDLSILNDVPSDLLFLTCSAEELRQRVDPWLAASTTWQPVELVQLVAPRVDFVCADRVYRRKDGSVGLLCSRI